MRSEGDYKDGKVDKGVTYIVQEIVARCADGASCRVIASRIE